VQVDGVITEAIAILKVGVEIGFDGSKYITKEARLIHEILILDLAPKKYAMNMGSNFLGIYYC
jgi:hypothetical protein